MRVWQYYSCSIERAIKHVHLTSNLKSNQTCPPFPLHPAVSGIMRIPPEYFLPLPEHHRYLVFNVSSKSPAEAFLPATVEDDKNPLLHRHHQVYPYAPMTPWWLYGLPWSLPKTDCSSVSFTQLKKKKKVISLTFNLSITCLLKGGQAWTKQALFFRHFPTLSLLHYWSQLVCMHSLFKFE